MYSILCTVYIVYTILVCSHCMYACTGCILVFLVPYLPYNSSFLISTPPYLYRALSMGVHESQSLFWERMIFQSREFWEYFTPIVHR